MFKARKRRICPSPGAPASDPASWLGFAILTPDFCLPSSSLTLVPSSAWVPPEFIRTIAELRARSVRIPQGPPATRTSSESLLDQGTNLVLIGHPGRSRRFLPAFKHNQGRLIGDLEIFLKRRFLL